MLLRRQSVVLGCSLGVGCVGYDVVAPDCLPISFSEIAAANETVNLLPVCANEPLIGWCCEQPDWVELRNDGDHEIDVSGYSLSVTVDAPLRSFGDLDGRPHRLRPHALMIVIMAPQVPDLRPDDPCAAVMDVAYAFGGIDLDRDGGVVLELRSPSGAVCKSERYPDQHADFSWSFPEGCATEPTPGAENADCLCDQSGAPC